MLSFNCLLESLHDKSTTQIPYLKIFQNIFIKGKKNPSPDFMALHFTRSIKRTTTKKSVVFAVSHSSFLFYSSAFIKIRCMGIILNTQMYIVKKMILLLWHTYVVQVPEGGEGTKIWGSIFPPWGRKFKIFSNRCSYK